MRRLITSMFAAGFLLTPSAGQTQSNFAPSAGLALEAVPGWTFTPGIGAGTSWDSNVLVRGEGNETPDDVLNVVSPRAALTFNGARGQMSATYDGSFLLYRQLDELNSFDQRSTFYARRLVTKHVALFARNTAAFVPTTELAEFIAVPFVRTGSRLEDLHGGVDAALSKRTTLSASYDFQIVDFNQDVPGAASRLQGGHSHGASLTWRRMMNARLALTGDYRFQHAQVRLNQTFDIQNWWAGVDYQISEQTHVFAAGGVSRLGVTQFSTDRTGPAFRAGVLRSLRTASLDVHYSRSFVPSYGFGGTMQNEEATARLRFPVSRRVSASSAVSWRRDDPLTLGELPLRTYWIEGTVAYAATPWVRIEGYFAGTHQTIQRAGGVLDRNRAGIQVVTAKPVRVH